jgi:hypothetical protein
LAGCENQSVVRDRQDVVLVGWTVFPTRCMWSLSIKAKSILFLGSQSGLCSCATPNTGVNTQNRLSFYCLLLIILPGSSVSALAGPHTLSLSLSLPEMSNFQSSYPVNSNPYYPQHIHQPTEDHKSHHDDLIDEYASPYAKTSHHQTFAVEATPTSPSEHRRRPSFPASKISYSSEYTKESGEAPNVPPSRTYPPLPLTKDMPVIKEADSRSLWQKVCGFAPCSMC